MKKKIILLVLCAVLLLMFTSSSYGGFDPNYMERLRERPDQELRGPPMQDQSHDILLVIIPNGKGLFVVVRAQRNPSKGDASLRNSTTQVVGQACPQGLLDIKESSPECQEAKSK